MVIYLNTLFILFVANIVICGKNSEFNSNNRHINFYLECNHSCYVNEQLYYTKSPMSDYITRNNSVYFRFKRDIKDILCIFIKKNNRRPFELRRDTVVATI